MIRALLSYSRQSEIEGNTVDLSGLLEKLVTICAKTFGAEYTVRMEDRLNGAVVEGDEDALVQALLNVCINARDAMPGGGEITLTLDATKPSRSVLARKPEALPGETYYSLSVADEGHGIPSGLFDKVFDPFFSTKPSGDGTGLGLTMAYNTVRSHGGFIDLTSAPDQGTVFRVNIPVPRTTPADLAGTGEAADA